MIGLDTNILVRYFARDDPVQSPKATAIFEHRLSKQNPGYVSIVAVVEVMWVLARSYRLTTHQLVDVIERLLQADNLVIEDAQDVFTAMIALKEGRGSFADAMIVVRGQRAGCVATWTFDREALRLPGYVLP